MITKEEAVKMAADCLRVKIPQMTVTRAYSVSHFDNGQDRTNRSRAAITVIQDHQAQVVIQSKLLRWSVNNELLTTEVPQVLTSSLTSSSLFRHVMPGPARQHNASMFLAEDRPYPLSYNVEAFTNDTLTVAWVPHHEAFREDASDIFSPNVLATALEPFRHELRETKRAAAKLVRGQLFQLSVRKQEYVAAVKILGRRPTYNEVTLVQLMWPAISPLMDTPLVIEPMLVDRKNDIMKRKKATTTLKAIERTRKVTSAQITQYGKRVIDPLNVLLPRQWRWLMRQKARNIRWLTESFNRYPRWRSPLPRAWKMAFFAEFFPDIRAYARVLAPLEAELFRAITKSNAGNTDGLPELVRVFLNAVKRHEDGNKNKDAAFSNEGERVKILKAVIDVAGDVEMDAELRQANLGTLYALVRDLQVINMEPEASLQYGRHAFDFPNHSKNITYKGYEFVPLKDHVMVYEEGQRMRHCLFAGWMRGMISGDYRAYGVINHKDEAIGTLLLNVNRSASGRTQYSVAQFAGQLNENLLYQGPYTGLMRDFANELNRMEAA